MSVRFKWPPDLAAFRFGSALIWALRGGGIPATITGISPLSLVNAIARPITKLLQHGKVAVSGTDVICNNGTLKFGATGNNLAEMSEKNIVVGKYISATGSVNTDANNFFYQSYIPVTPNTAYTLSVSQTCYFISISEYQADKTFIVRNAGNTNIKNLTITTGADTYFIRFGSNMNRTTLSLEDVLAVNWMLNKGDAGLPYEPFIGGIYADGTREVITLSAAGAEDQTAHAENLFAVGDIEDTQDIISGTVTRRTEAVVSDGTTPSGRYVGTVGEGNIIVKARETGYTGEIVSFETEEEKPLNGLIVQMEPVQDLHGYSNPWPAGGGKNLFDKGANISANAFYVNSEGMEVSTNNYRTTDYIPIKPNITYYWAINGVPPIPNPPVHQAPRVAYYDSEKSWLASGNELGTSGSAYTSPATAAYARLPVYTYMPETIATAMFLEGNSIPTTYSPFSNICPISGWTGCEVYRTGKNVINVDEFSTRTTYGITITNNGDGSLTLSGIATSTFTVKICTIKKAGSFILNGCPQGGGNSTYRLDVRRNGGSIVVPHSDDSGSGSSAFTAQVGDEVSFRIANGLDATTPVVFWPMMRLDTDTDPTFEPYQGEEVSVTFPSVNIWDEEWEEGYYDVADGLPKPSQSWIRSKNDIHCAPNTSYCARQEAVGGTLGYLLFYKTNGEYISYTAIPSSAATLGFVFTTPNECQIIKLYNGSRNTGIGFSINYPSFETGYHAHTEPIEVYGGTPDIVNGEMPVTMARVNMGSLTWQRTTYSGATMMVCSISAKSRVGGNPIHAICSIYEASDDIWSSETLRDKIFSINYAGNQLYVYDSDYTDAAEFKAAMSDVQLVYKLATPIPTAITPTPINTLEGDNNIWSNAGAVAVYVPTGDLIEQVTPQKLSTTEGNNTITVTAEVDDIVFDVTYSENNPDG